MVDLLDVMAVNSIAELVALVGSIDAGTIYKTTGYYFVGDGGHGSYVYDPASTLPSNGGTVIQPTTLSGRWLLISSPINIKQFGAQSTGYGSYAITAAQNAACIQAAIDYCAANSLGLFVPAGHYTGTRLRFKNLCNCQNGGSRGAFVFYGEGSANYKQLTGSISGSVLEMTYEDAVAFDASSDSDVERLAGFQINDLTLVGDSSVAVLDTAGAFQCVFKNVTIYNKNSLGSGWLSRSSVQSTFENIQIVKFGDDSESTSIGLDLGFCDYFVSAVDTRINVFSNVLVVGCVYGIKCGLDSEEISGKFHCNTFTSCIIYSSKNGLILSGNCSENSFIDCFFATDFSALAIIKSNSNVFISCWIASVITGASGGVVYIGDGNSSDTGFAKSNIFNQCKIECIVPDATKPVLWTIGESHLSTLDCQFIDCEFVLQDPGEDPDGVYVFNFTSDNVDRATGSIIRPVFNASFAEGLFQYFPESIGYEPINQALHKYSEVNSTGNAWTVIDRLVLNTGDVVTINATLLGKNTTMVSEQPSDNHAAFVLQGTFYLHHVTSPPSNVATVVSTSTTIVSQKNDPSSTQECKFDTDGDEVLIMVRGMTGNTMEWSCKSTTLIL